MRLNRFGVVCASVYLCSFGFPRPAASARADETVTGGNAAIQQDAGVLIVDDDQLKQRFTETVASLIGDTADDFVAGREAQLQRRTSTLDLPAAGKRRLSPPQIYRKRIDSVVVVGVFYHCKSKQCQRLHSSLSSGVVIHEDGVLLTNYHVVDVKQPRFLAMAVMTLDGHVYLVDEVLAADPVHDVAVVKLRDAKGLSAAPVFRDEPVGRPVTLITHPRHNFYSLTSGIVSRYSMGDNTNVVMNITADYAIGSSGGPVFNNRGDIVGLVSSTTSIAAGNVRLNPGADSRIDLKLPADAALRRPDPDVRCVAEEGPGEGHDPEDEAPPQEEGMPIKGPRVRPRSGTVNIPTNHQMTIKNTVPSRAILDLFTD